MKTDKFRVVSLSEASQDFAGIAELADRYGEIYIIEGDRLRYRLSAVEGDAEAEMTDGEKIDFVAERVLREYRRAFEELAK